MSWQTSASSCGLFVEDMCGPTAKQKWRNWSARGGADKRVEELEGAVLAARSEEDAKATVIKVCIWAAARPVGRAWSSKRYAPAFQMARTSHPADSDVSRSRSAKSSSRSASTSATPPPPQVLPKASTGGEAESCGGGRFGVRIAMTRMSSLAAATHAELCVYWRQSRAEDSRAVEEVEKVKRSAEMEAAEARGSRSRTQLCEKWASRSGSAHGRCTLLPSASRIARASAGDSHRRTHRIRRCRCQALLTRNCSACMDGCPCECERTFAFWWSNILYSTYSPEKLSKTRKYYQLKIISVKTFQLK